MAIEWNRYLARYQQERGGYFFGNIPIIRDHLNTIVLIGVGGAVIPLVLGGLWKFYTKTIRSH